MRLVSFVQSAATAGPFGRVGALVDDGVVDLAAISGSLGHDPALDQLQPFPAGMIDLLERGAVGLDAARAIVTFAEERPELITRISDCRLLPPVPRPPKLVCVGMNYQPMAERVTFRAGEGAPVFLKATSSITGPDSSIELPSSDIGPVTVEVELGVVIGAEARGVAASHAFDIVAGYLILLDVTAQAMLERDAYAFRPPASATEKEAEQTSSHIVLFRAKDFDTFTPIGPALVTRDEMPDESTAALPISGHLNGEAYVEGSTRDMIVGIPELIEFVTSVMTLVPGDVIATGHPGYLQHRPIAPGDRIEAQIGHIGPLRVTVGQGRSDPGN